MNWKLKIAILITAIFSTGYVYATGTISGRVSDQYGAPLAYANVVITHKFINGQPEALRAQIGTVTVENGDYTITGLEAGTYKLNVIYLGYDSDTKTVNVPEGGAVIHNVSMQNHTMDLKEVIVTTQAKGQMAAINQQLSSLTIKNVVAADRIIQNPDANAAEAIGRLPGISVTRSGGEANDVVIRGMAPMYNTVLLNGIEVPSNKGAERSAGLGGLSQFSLQGIEVFKAITPDMEANTVSGAVNMKMKSAPEGFHGNIMAQSGYNAQNNYFGNYILL
ncbi:MAG: carboxypeptidase regulatory-like domain-containing protein [Bacteroidales bacterium]|nr:carboxypeptidase regulatory-like domain-containing protein [Bacteroidales bacterium]